MSIATDPFTTAAAAMTSLTGSGSASASTTPSGLAGLGSSAATTGETAAPFADLMTDSVQQVGKLEDEARTTVDKFMTGSGVDVHQAMIATQKANMAFEMVLAVRNKAVQAYQSVIGMQF